MKLYFQYKSDSKIESNGRFRDNFKLMQFPEFPFIKVILVNTLAMSLLGLAIPLSIQSVINTITSRAMFQPLVMLCLILMFILSFSGVLQAIQTYTVEVLKRRIFVRFGLVISERMTHYNDEVFRKENSPALINRYFDTLIMQSSMVTFFVDGFGFFVMFFIGFGLLIFYHPIFLAFAIAMAVFLIANWIIFGPDGVRAGSPEADGKYNLISWIEELSRVRNMFASEKGRDFSNKKVTSLFNLWLDKRNNLFNYQFRQHLGLQIFSVTTNVLLLFIGGYLVLQKELSIGQLVAAALVVSNITSSIPRLQNFFCSIYEYSTSLDKIAQFYDYPLEKSSSQALEVTQPEVQFKDTLVSPNYSFNFTIPVKKRVFILVKSFSSIDVMYDLIMGFISPKSGTIYIDGKHLDDIQVSKFRDQVQLVRRDQFFAGTILENLIGLHGKEELSMSEIHSTLEKVGLWENIQQLPEGLQTQIRPNGFPLSKSQLMTLQVARAILNKPKLLFMTPDFEQISSYKRRKVLKEIMDPSYGWTLLFFTQKQYTADFDLFTYLNRDGLQQISDNDALIKEIEDHV